MLTRYCCDRAGTPRGSYFYEFTALTFSWPGMMDPDNVREAFRGKLKQLIANATAELRQYLAQQSERCPRSCPDGLTIDSVFPGRAPRVRPDHASINRCC